MSNEELIITNELKEQTIQEKQESERGKEKVKKTTENALEGELGESNAHISGEENTPAVTSGESNAHISGEEYTPSAASKDSNTPATGSGVIKEADSDPSFREILREQIHEEEQAQSPTFSVIKILGGDFFTSQILRRQIWLMLLIFAFMIMYVSNRYSCQKSMLEIDNLRKELQDAKYKALSTSSSLTERSRQSKVLDMLKENNDSVLHIATQPPYIINVREE